MRAMDGPDRGQGSVSEPDGGARSPSELLDNLRLRLSQLAENHPSAPQRAEPGRGPGEPSLRRPDWADAVPDAVPEREQAAVDGATGGGERVGGGERAGGDERAGGGDYGRVGPEERGGGLGSGLGGDVLAGPGAGGALGDLDLPGLHGASEPYRPWFLAGEAGEPWWADGEDL